MAGNNNHRGRQNYPTGEDLKIGSVVKLCDLASARGQQLNQKVAKILTGLSQERYGVELLASGEKMSIQPKNLRIVCSFCHKDNFDFYTCEDCEVSRYCDQECQKKDWAKQPMGHRTECVMLGGRRRNTYR